MSSIILSPMILSPIPLQPFYLNSYLMTFSIPKAQKKLLALPENKNKWGLGGPFRRQNLQKELQLGIIKLQVERTWSVDSVLQTDFRPDILTNHVDWSPEILKVMPSSKQITIVRDPIQQFISAFEYYHKQGSTDRRSVRDDLRFSKFCRSWSGLV